MLEHDSHSRLLAKKAALDRLDSTSLKPQAQKLNERGVRVLADADRAIATADKYFNALRPTKSGSADRKAGSPEPTIALDEPALNSSHDHTSAVRTQQWPPPLAPNAGRGKPLLGTPESTDH
jgi:hypothetical protein